MYNLGGAIQSAISSRTHSRRAEHSEARPDVRSKHSLIERRQTTQRSPLEFAALLRALAGTHREHFHTPHHAVLLSRPPYLLSEECSQLGHVVCLDCCVSDWCKARALRGRSRWAMPGLTKPGCATRFSGRVCISNSKLLDLFNRDATDARSHEPVFLYCR